MSTLFDLDTLTPKFAFAPRETPTPTVPPPAINRAVLLAQRYHAIIAEGQLDRQSAVTLGNELFAGTIPQGAWKISTAYNAIEAAVARIVATDPSVAAETLLERIPTQTRRTLDTTALQQFSTPPTIGAIVNQLAGITADDLVCEPSCGTGLLASFAKRNGASLILNEIDPERRALAAYALDAATILDVDAKELPLFYAGDAPSVIIANPPFTADGNLEGSDVALRHLTAAFALLRPYGRLVAVVGQFQHPKLRPDLWARLLTGARLRYAVAIDGEAYRRFGTATSVAIVVLDKIPTGATVDFPAATNDSSERKLDDLRTSLPHLPRLATTVTSLETYRGEKRGGKKAQERPAWTPIVTEPQAPVRFSLNTEARTIPDDAVWVPYVPTLRIENARPHPDQLDEPAALASVPRYLPSLSLKLPARVVRDGVLSDVQLESIIYALDATSRSVLLKNEAGETYTAAGGHILGHGTGVGKGRIIAGTILARVNEGAGKFLWISENIDLLASAQRDWDFVAGPGHENALFSVNAIAPNSDIPHIHGIGFTTFSTLRGQATHTTRARFAQLEAWGDDIDTIFIDESHNAQNAAGAAAVDDKTTTSLQGRVICQLQERFPKARVIYISATSITKIDAFSYTERLGLWGPDTDFATREAFLASVEAGKLGALELFCRELRSQGLYQAASLRESDITTETLVHHLTEVQIEQYNHIARCLRVINQHAKEALDLTNASGRAAGRALSQLAIMEQKVLQGVLISMRVGTMIGHIETALADGKAIVIQTAATGEAAQKRAVAKDPSLENLDLSPREFISQYLDRAFPIQAHRIDTDANGNQTSIPLEDEEGRPILDPVAIELRDSLKTDLHDVLVPDSALNLIINHFGADNVAECTGRGERLITTIEDGETKRILQRRPPGSNNAETEAFMLGKKMILIFSEQAGGTGRSFHSDKNYPNQAQRYHYCMHVGWSSAKARQARGRTHRTNQAIKPHFVDVITDAPGERRFISTTSRNNATIGASTQGQRNAISTGLYCAEANLETEYGQEAVNALAQDIFYNRVTDFSYAQWLDQASIPIDTTDEGALKVRRFLNRLLCCNLGPDSPQELLFAAFTEHHRTVIEKAKERGTYDAGIQAYNCQSASVVNRRVLRTDELTGAETVLLDIDVVRRREARRFNEARAHVNTVQQYFPHEAWYTIDNDVPCAVYKTAFTRQVNGKTEFEYSVAKPFERTWTTTPPHGRSIEETDARDLWKKTVESTDALETKRIYLLIGPVRKVYQKLGSHLEVVRLTLDGGKTQLGVLLASPYIALQNLGHAIDPDDIVSALRARRGGLSLAGSLMLKSVRYAEEQAIELDVPQWLASKVMPTIRSLDLVIERKAFKERIFVPKHRLQAVLEAFPLVENSAA